MEAYEKGDIVVIVEKQFRGGHWTRFLQVEKVTPKGWIVGGMLANEVEEVVNSPIEIVKNVKPRLWESGVSNRVTIRKGRYGQYVVGGTEVFVSPYDPTKQYQTVLYYD